MVASPPPPPAITTFHVYESGPHGSDATIPTAAGVTFPIYVAPGVCTYGCQLR